MKKVRIIAPDNEKKQNYGYMHPLRTREKHLYKTHSKHWSPNSKKKKPHALFSSITSCYRKISDWNNINDEGVGELSAQQLQQLYLFGLLMGKIK